MKREPETFGHVLEAMAPPRADRRDAGAFANPLATAAAPIPADASRAGVDNLWDHAFAWALEPPAEASPEPPPPRAALPSDDAEAIAAELGLPSLSTRTALRRARRGFMWRNHPDRRPEIPPALANRRVAIANMLIDRALAVLARSGG